MARWRFSEKFRNRDWWGIGIDLGIVVLGVFLGIQASNWNQARLDREAGRAYLVRIRDDLTSDLRNLDDHERYWRESADAGRRALRFAEDGVRADEWALLNDFFGAGQRWAYSISDATYSELLSAGRLDLIPDAAFRKQLADYYLSKRDQTAFLADPAAEYRHEIRTIIPSDIQEYLVERCQRGVSTLFTRSCPPLEASVDIGTLDRKIAANEALVGELRSWMTTVAYLRSIGNEQRTTAARLVAEVDRSLS
jgi:hypothetical protein